VRYWCDLDLIIGSKLRNNRSSNLSFVCKCNTRIVSRYTFIFSLVTDLTLQFWSNAFVFTSTARSGFRSNPTTGERFQITSGKLLWVRFYKIIEPHSCIMDVRWYPKVNNKTRRDGFVNVLHFFRFDVKRVYSRETRDSTVQKKKWLIMETYFWTRFTLLCSV
jgi:hypothetical protein